MVYRGNRLAKHASFFLALSVLLLSSSISVGPLSFRSAARPETGESSPEPGNGPSPTRTAVRSPYLECPENTTKSAYPIDLIVFNLTVTNRGDAKDSYRVETSSIEGWQFIVYPDRFEDLPPVNSTANESEKIKDLRIQIVVGDAEHATVGNYTVAVILISESSPQNRSQVNLSVEVLPDARLELHPLLGEQYILPGETLVFEFGMTNLGNGDFTYDVLLNVSGPGWHAELVDSDQSTIFLGIHERVNISIIVFAPMDVQGNTAAVIRVSMARHGEPASSSFIIRIRVPSPPSRSYEAIVNDPLLKEEPGENVTFLITVKYIGNGAYYPVEISVEEDPFGGNITIDDSELGDDGRIEGNDADLYVHVRIPDSTAAGKYNITLSLLVNGEHRREILLNIEVLTSYRASIEYGDSEKGGRPGEKTSFSAYLLNTGNLPCNFNWSVVADNTSWIDTTADRFILPPGETREIVFNVTVSEFALPGKYRFALSVHSKNNDNIRFERDFLLKVLKRSDFRFSPINGTFYVNPGFEKFVDIPVENTGNVNVTLTFDLIGESWGAMLWKGLFIPYRGKKVLPLHFEMPRETDRDRYLFDLIGTITTDTDITKNFTLDLRLARFEFACSDIYVEDEVPGLTPAFLPGENVHFYTEVFNKGSLHFNSSLLAANLTAAFYIGDVLLFNRTIPNLGANDSIAVEFDHTFFGEGKYVVVVRINEDRLLNETDHGDNVGKIEVKVMNGEEDGSDTGEGNDRGEGGLTRSDLVKIVLVILLCAAITA